MKKIILSLMAVATVFCASAQDVKTVYNEAVTAYGEKKFDVAAEKFNSVLDLGLDDESAGDLVKTAQTYIPKCYYMYGGRAMQSGNYDVAIENFTKSAEYAELWGDMTTQLKATSWIGKTYQKQGGDAFNAKDFETAKVVFSKGYAADPKNTEMAIWLGICYCETDEFEKGMETFYDIVKMGSNPKYAEAAEEAAKNIGIYTNNRVAAFQTEKNYDGVITMADWILSQEPTSALAEKIRLQAYFDKADYAKVYELGEAAAAAQTTDEEKSNVYFILGAAYNAKEMKPQAIAAFQKVVAGPNAETAKATVAELSK